MQYKGKQFDLTTADRWRRCSTPPPAQGERRGTSTLVSAAFSVGALGHEWRRQCTCSAATTTESWTWRRTPSDPEVASLKRCSRPSGADRSRHIQHNAFSYQYGRWTVIIWSYLRLGVHHGEGAAWVLLDSKYNQTYGAVWNDRVKTGSALHRGRETRTPMCGGPQPVQRSQQLQRLALCRRGRRCPADRNFARLSRQVS